MPDILIGHEALHDFTRSLLTAIGVPEEAAELVSESLVATNLRGVDSHGVQLLPFYIERIRAGGIDVKAKGRVASENGACPRVQKMYLHSPTRSCVRGSLSRALSALPKRRPQSSQVGAINDAFNP